MKKFNFYLGASVSAWLLTIMVIISEIYDPFKNLLKSIFSHHWLGKLIVISLAFVVFGFLLRNKKSMFNINDDKLAWNSVVWSIIIIFLFFIFEYFM